MRRLTVVLVVLFMVGMASAVDPYDYQKFYQKQNAGHLIGGEHTPIIYSGSGMCSNTSSVVYTTRWLLVGFAEGATRRDSKDISYFNPEIFTVGIRLDIDGSDCGLTSAYFEYCLDSAETDRIKLTLGNNTQPLVEFLIDDVITGSISGATAKIFEISIVGADTFLLCHGVEGVFDVTPAVDVVTGSLSGVSAEISAKSSIWDRSGWNADSSNFFIGDFYTRLKYGQGKYEVITDSSRYYWMKHERLIGGYYRMIFESDSAGESTVNWTLICEN